MTSKVIKRTQCPNCLDTGKDNLTVYEDGSSFCFACNISKPKTLLDGSPKDLTARRITRETCAHFKYHIGKYTGKIGGRACKEEPVHIANYIDNYGNIVAQKLRTRTKEMIILGKAKEMSLYGQWLYQPNDKLFVTVVEGEIDALSVAQAQGVQFPVVSIANGAANAKKELEKHLPWLMGFKYVILAFDNDEAGRKATEECVELFEYGKVRVVQWPLKDANEMLQAGRADELKSLLFNAKVIVPDNIVTVSDILDKILTQPQRGIDYPFPSLTDITYGFRLGEIHIIVAANGIGKTEYMKELMYFLLSQQLKVGLFSFEQDPESTIQRLIGSKLKLKLHIPGSEWDKEKIKASALELDNKIYLYNHVNSGAKVLENSIRYLAKAKDVKLIIVDNLKGLKKGNSDTKGYLQEVMLTFQSLARELKLTFFLLSHVAKDKYSYQAYVSTSPKHLETYSSLNAEDIEQLVKRPGMEWESGRMPSKENVEGESAVCDLADYVFALARNTVSEDSMESRTTRVKCLKARLDGSKTGKQFKLFYSDDGSLEELNGSGGF